MLGGKLDRPPVGRAPAAAVEDRPRGDAAWLAAIPCALAAFAAILLLTPPLSPLLYPSAASFHLLPGDLRTLSPEPEEGTRYLLALSGPVLLALATAALTLRPPRLPRRARSALVLGTQLLLVGVIVACFVGLHDAHWTIVYFTAGTLFAAALVAAAIVLAATVARVRPDLSRVDRSRAGRAVLAVAAFTAAALWIVPGIDTEESITWSLLHHDVAFQLDETFAVINGLTPLADFHAQYASLLPYVIAGSLLAFGKTVLVFTITVCALSVLVFCAIYDVLRRAARSSLAALALFVPVLATSLFNPENIPFARFTPGTYFPMFPFRYGGAYLLAWLVARRLDAGRRSRDRLLFATGGLVVLNNFEFGVPAFAATVAALLAGGVARRRDELLRFAGDVALGLLVAVAAVSALTLLRAGALPDLAAIPRFARLYAVAGYAVWPIPGLLGLPLIIYLTYVAAIGTAVVRALGHAPNRVLTGMLMWAGLFGLGIGSYYVARSEWSLMPMMFSAWALTLALLTLAVVRELAAGGLRRAGLPALAVLFGIGLAVCSIGQFPFPGEQLDRIRTRPPLAQQERIEWSPQPAGEPFEREFIAATVAPDGSFTMRRGAPIALFATTGHRIADAYGVVDVVPFTGHETMHTLDEYERALDALRDAGGNTVLIPWVRVESLHAPLERRGFRIITRSGVRRSPIARGRAPGDAVIVDGLTKWIDMHAVRDAPTG
jgi:hypothetical protein